MSARDDYPLASHEWQSVDVINRALDEIDLLRGDVCVLLSKLAQAENWLRIATASNVSLWRPVPDEVIR